MNLEACHDNDARETIRSTARSHKEEPRDLYYIRRGIIHTLGAETG